MIGEMAGCDARSDFRSLKTRDGHAKIRPRRKGIYPEMIGEGVPPPYAPEAVECFVFITLLRVVNCRFSICISCCSIRN